MKRVFEESGVGDVVVNIRILNVLQTVCMKSLKSFALYSRSNSKYKPPGRIIFGGAI